MNDTVGQGASLPFIWEQLKTPHV